MISVSSSDVHVSALLKSHVSVDLHLTIKPPKALLLAFAPLELGPDLVKQLVYLPLLVLAFLDHRGARGWRR
jgi:hypothetical protein